jgi:hypothetical protein
LALLDEPETIGAGEAGEAPGELPTGTAGELPPGAAGELPAGAAGLVAGMGELALLDEPGTTGAGEAGEAAGELPTGAAGELPAGAAGELPAGAAGLVAGIGELPGPDEGPAGTTGVDAGGAAAADGDTVIVEYTVTGVHCEADEAPMGELALPD